MGGAEEKKVKVGEPGEEEGGSPKASQELVDSIEKLQVIQDELEAVRIMLLFFVNLINSWIVVLEIGACGFSSWWFIICLACG